MSNPKKYIKKIMSSDSLLKHTVKNGDCLEFSGHKDRNGYGLVYYQGKQRYAHRVIYILFYGGVPDDLYVCHKCDNPICINPEHLFPGTQKQNMQDMYSKGRQKKNQEFCKRGHPLSGANVYINERTKSRTCRACRTLRGQSK